MEIKNGTKYSSNYARAASYFLGTMGENPKQPDQNSAFNLIKGIYDLIATNPEKIGLSPKDDCWFNPWEQQKGRENDVKIIRGSFDKVEKLIKELFDLIISGEVSEEGIVLTNNSKPKRTLLNVLSELGVKYENGCLNFSYECAVGLKELAKISQANVIKATDSSKENKEYFYFSHGVFNVKSDWIIDDLDKLLQADGQLVWLCRELQKRGYERIDCKDGERISLDFVKQFGKTLEPVKLSWADKTHGGIEVTYEDLRLEPCYIWLRVPNFKTVLENIGNLSSDVLKFLSNNIKTCNGCKYCVQTDKTHTRPIAAVDVNGKKKCPYFPSFSLNWRALDHELASQMLAMIDAIEQIL